MGTCGTVLSRMSFTFTSVQKEAQERVRKYGENELEKAEGPSVVKMFFKQFFDFMVIILMLAGVGSLVLRVRAF